MASVSPPLCDVTTLKTPLSSSSNFGSTPKPSQLFLLGKRNHSFKFSCKVSNNDQKHNQNNETNSSVDRRNVLLGLGGLYGASNIAAPLIASANPVKSDVSSCGLAVISDDISAELPSNRVKCCLRTPDDPTNIPYYKLPPVSELRIRPAAHDVDQEYIDKYNEAYRLMKELDQKDPDDPRGFRQQALIHCAYCNGSYKEGNQVLQIHGSWLFFPFHRWYLNFHERILGSLINDPTFALPYWNWDHPKGMRMPPMFDSPEIVNRQGKTVKNNLYDIKRNTAHRGKALLDLGSYGTEAQATDLQVMSNNLTQMYRQMITNAPCAQLFFGKKYSSGDDYKKLNGQGTIENIPHTPVHIWVGGEGTDVRTDTPNHEDMGNFYSAGYDPVFYSHHANVDRMWTIWKTLGGKRRDFPEDEKDFHDAEFFLYDEHKNPYKVKVKDCLDSRKMGYDFQPMAIPWRNFKPLKKTSNSSSSIPAPSGAFKPIQSLDKVITFSVPRPNKNEGNQKGESLILGGVAHDGSKHIRFDVFLNVDVKNHKFNELDSAEFLGSYISLPHQVHGKETPNSFQLVITESIEILNLQNEDTLNVNLVPKAGGELVSVKSAEIILENC